MKENLKSLLYVVMVFGGITLLIIALLGVRWLILEETPCSMFTLAEAPVRCVK